MKLDLGWEVQQPVTAWGWGLPSSRTFCCH